MTRTGYDCTSASSQWVRTHLKLPDVMFWYGTGSTGIAWTPEQVALFPKNIMCEIDQGGAGTPVPSATVLDVETGAWTVSTAIQAARNSRTPKTLYGSRSTLATCAAAGYQGPFWLAWPGWTGETLPAYPGIEIVAVQDQWNPDWDHSTILSPTWPFGNVVTPPPGQFSVTVISRAMHMFYTVPAGTDHGVVEYLPEGGGQQVRIGDAPVNVSPRGVHFINISAPGAKGGTVIGYAIVHGKPVECGRSKLP